MAEAVSASHDLRLQAEHMPLDAEIGSSKRKKKSLAGWRTERIFGGIIPSNDVESWLNMVKHIKNDGLMEIFCGDTI